MKNLLPTESTDRPNNKHLGSCASALRGTFASSFGGKGIFWGGYSGLRQERREINNGLDRDGLPAAGEHLEQRSGRYSQVPVPQ